MEEVETVRSMGGVARIQESLNRKVLIALTLISVLFLAVNVAVHHLFVSPSFARLEHTAVERDLTLAKDSITREITYLGHQCDGWAIWKETNLFADGTNPNFLKIGIDQEALEQAYGINLFCICNTDGKILFRSAYVPAMGGRIEMEEFSSESLPLDHLLLQHPTRDSRIDGLWNTSRGMTLISSRAIASAEGNGSIKGTVILGKFLDRDVVATLAQQTHVCFHTTNLLSDPITDKHKAILGVLETEPFTLENIHEGVLFGYAQMRDLTGSPAVLISADIPRHVTAQGKKAIAFTRTMVLLLSVAILVAVYLLMKRLVLARLNRICQCVEKIEASGDLQIRTTEHGGDELGVLAATLNRMLDRLQQYETSIQESEKYHRMIFQTAGEGMVVVDANENILYANEAACRMHGYTEAEFMGLHAFDLIAPEDHSELDRIKNRIDKGDTFCVEMVHRRKDQTHFNVEVRGSRLHHTSGRQTLIVVNDITNRLKTQADLEEAKRTAEQASMAKTAFLANMSHEIRTPMTAILGYAEYILQPSLSELERNRAVQNIQRQSEHLLTLIDEILDISKSEAGALDVRTTRSSPLAILAEIYSIMQERASAKGIALKFEYLSPIPETIYTDPIRLKQILINLTGNAVKFTDRGGVRVAIRYLDEYRSDSVAHGPGLQFDIIDSGIGLSPEQLDRLFEPFSQVDPSTTRQYGGLGLGLIICKRLAALLGGEIIVDSQLGYGSTFRLRIPTHQLHDIAFILHPGESMITSREKPRTESGLADSLNCKILLAEDGPDNQRLISFLLRKAGADVTVAENGRVAVDRVFEAISEGFPYDVILMDMQMPVLDGYQATMELRQRGHTGPIIAVTAHAMDGDREKCLRCGCDDYVTKPVERTALLASIERLLTTSSREHVCAAADRGQLDSEFLD